MGITTAIQSRKISREMLAWKERQANTNNNTTVEKGLYSHASYMVVAQPGMNHIALKANQVRASLQAVTSLNPFVLTAINSAHYTFNIEVEISKQEDMCSEMLAVRINNADAEYADYTIAGSTRYRLHINSKVYLAQGDTVIIELRCNNTLVSTQELYIYNTRIEIE